MKSTAKVIKLERHAYAPEQNRLHLKFRDGEVAEFMTPGVTSLAIATALWHKYEQNIIGIADSKVNEIRARRTK